MWAPECACTEHWSSSCKPLVSLLLSVPPSHPSPQKIKAPHQRPECTQPRSRAATGPWASRPALRAWEEATQKLLLTPPALALHVRIQGRPGAAHPSPGREPPELLHSGPSPEALASSLRAALCPSSPPPPRRNAAKEPFSRQKKKKKKKKSLKRASFSSRQEQGDEIHNSRETGLDWLPSSLSAGMEPQSLSGNGRRTVCTTRTQGRSPRADGGCCPASCVPEAHAGNSRDRVGGPFPPPAPLSDSSKAAPLTSSPGWGWLESALCRLGGPG